MPPFRSDDSRRLLTIVVAALFAWLCCAAAAHATAPPTITSFSPTSGPVGTTVVINGTNFIPPLSIVFTGGAYASGSFTSTQITVTVPSGAETGPVKVTTSGGSVSTATPFTVGDVSVSATTTRLSTTPNPSRAGQSVVLAAQVDGLGGGAPTGIVAFSDGATALGQGTLTAAGAGQATIAAGAGHSCAIDADGGLECWGYAKYGQLGDGAKKQQTKPIQVTGLDSGVAAVAAGDVNACAITGSGAVQCWGDNSMGELGDGTTTNSFTPVNVSGLSGGVLAVSAGSRHSCALTSAGAVQCWGSNVDGQLGDGSTTQRSTPVSVSGLSGVTAIAVGGDHSCALTSGGAVHCWGDNSSGQLGDGSTAQSPLPVQVKGLTSGVVSIAVGLSHSCAVTGAGAVECWGANSYGQLGDGTTRQRIKPVAVSGLSGAAGVTAGADHSCALTSAGGVECWGDNAEGQLGDGSTAQHLTPVAVSGLSNGGLAVAAGGTHTCATAKGGDVRCWGDNSYGQLGDGTTAGSSVYVEVKHIAGVVRAQAKLAVSTLGAGNHTLTADYQGDGSHSGSSASVSQKVK